MGAKSYAQVVRGTSKPARTSLQNAARKQDAATSVDQSQVSQQQAPVTNILALPQDLLRHIAAQLPELLERVQLSLVCRHFWQAMQGPGPAWHQITLNGMYCARGAVMASLRAWLAARPGCITHAELYVAAGMQWKRLLPLLGRSLESLELEGQEVVVQAPEVCHACARALSDRPAEQVLQMMVGQRAVTAVAANCGRLVSLRLHQVATGVDCACLGRLTRLTQLHVCYAEGLASSFPAPDLPAELCALTRLQRLTFISSGLSQLPPSFSRLLALTALELARQDTVQEVDLEPCVHLPSLATLVLCNVDLLDATELTRLAPLSRLCLIGCVLGDTLCRAAAPGLRALTVCQCDVGTPLSSAGILGAVSALSSLSRLEVCHCDLVQLPAGLEAMSQLARLSLVGNRLRVPPCLSGLSQLTALTQLDLRANPVRNRVKKALRALQAARPGLQVRVGMSDEHTWH